MALSRRSLLELALTRSLLAGAAKGRRAPYAESDVGPVWALALGRTFQEAAAAGPVSVGRVSTLSRDPGVIKVIEWLRERTLAATIQAIGQPAVAMTESKTEAEQVRSGSQGELDTGGEGVPYSEYEIELAWTAPLAKDSMYRERNGRSEDSNST